MTTTKSLGRLVGGLLILQLSGFIVPFVLLHPMNSAGFLSAAAPVSFQIKLAVFWLFANCALTVGISIAVLPLFKGSGERLVLLLLTVSAIMLVLQAVDNVHLMSMLSLSHRYLEATNQNELYHALAEFARSTRRWAHFPELIAIDVWIITLYAILFRSSIVPRLIAGIGLVTVAIHFVAIPLPLVLGFSGVTPLGALMGVWHLVLGGWLIARGFTEGNRVPEPAGG